MPSLAQLIQSVNQASYWSRGADEVLRALDYAQRKVYFAVTKELRLSFLKIDPTSITLVPGTAIYTLPADFSELKQLAERANASLPWCAMAPADLNDRDFLEAQAALGDLAGVSGTRSGYQYAGPYLDGQQAQAGAAVWNVEIAPVPEAALLCQIVYIAKYVPITGANSFLMIPDEGRDAVEAIATAELLRRNSDQGAAAYEARGKEDLDYFLTWMRDRQIQQAPLQEPYLSDLD